MNKVSAFKRLDEEVYFSYYYNKVDGINLLAHLNFESIDVTLEIPQFANKLALEYFKNAKYGKLYVRNPMGGVELSLIPKPLIYEGSGVIKFNSFEDFISIDKQITSYKFWLRE